MNAQLQHLADRFGTQPRKLVTIAVLALIFIVVCILQYRRMQGGSLVTLVDERPSTANALAEQTPASFRSENLESASLEEAPLPRSGNAMQDARDRKPVAPSDLDEAHSEELPSTADPSRDAITETVTIPIGQVVRFDPFSTLQIVDADQEMMSAATENTDLIAGAAQSGFELSNDLPVVVQQIVIGPAGSTARIGDAWLQVGDSWNGLYVREIRRDGVVLSAD